MEKKTQQKPIRKVELKISNNICEWKARKTQSTNVVLGDVEKKCNQKQSACITNLTTACDCATAAAAAADVFETEDQTNPNRQTLTTEEENRKK